MVWLVNYKLPRVVTRGLALCITIVTLTFFFGIDLRAIAQTDISRSQRLELRKSKKNSQTTYGALEKNYRKRQEEHYKMQDRRTRRIMRKGQKQARKQATRRSQPWVKRLVFRWKSRK